MLKLTMQCSRCGNTLEREVTDAATTVSSIMNADGFKYMYIDSVNRLVCSNCYEEFMTFQENLEREVANRYCDFFKKECKPKD